jgi:hypothetical protein
LPIGRHSIWARQKSYTERDARPFADLAEPDALHQHALRAARWLALPRAHQEALELTLTEWAGFSFTADTANKTWLSLRQ